MHFAIYSPSILPNKQWTINIQFHYNSREECSLERREKHSTKTYLGTVWCANWLFDQFSTTNTFFHVSTFFNIYIKIWLKKNMLKMQQKQENNNEFEQNHSQSATLCCCILLHRMMNCQTFDVYVHARHAQKSCVCVWAGRSYRVYIIGVSVTTRRLFACVCANFVSRSVMEPNSNQCYRSVYTVTRCVVFFRCRQYINEQCLLSYRSFLFLVSVCVFYIGVAAVYFVAHTAILPYVHIHFRYLTWIDKWKSHEQQIFFENGFYFWICYLK